MGGKSAARASILRIPMVAGEREFFSSIRICSAKIRIEGVSGARRVSGLSCGFGRHVPPGLVGLSFKCKAKTLTSGSVTVLRAKMSFFG
jgi:hypothetical protein